MTARVTHPASPTTAIAARPTAVLVGQGQAGRVGDRVVREDGDAREADGATEVERRGEHHDRRGDDGFGPHGERAALVDGGEPTGQLAPPRHRQDRAGDARDEVEEHAERSDAGADADDGRQPGEVRRADDEAERGVARGDGLDGHGGEHGDADGGVDHEDAGQGAGDRLGDGHGRIADLLAEGGDAGVAGEGEEQEACGAQHAARRGVDRGEPSERGRRARPSGDDHRRQRDERHGEQALGDRRPCGSVHRC